MIGTPTYDFTNFKVHVGRLTLTAYTKGEHVLRVEAISHNTGDFKCGRVLDRRGDICARLTGMADRFCTSLDCVDVAFLPDGLLDESPAAPAATTSRTTRPASSPASSPFGTTSSRPSSPASAAPASAASPPRGPPWTATTNRSESARTALH